MILYKKLLIVVDSVKISITYSYYMGIGLIVYYQLVICLVTRFYVGSMVTNYKIQNIFNKKNQCLRTYLSVKN